MHGEVWMKIREEREDSVIACPGGSEDGFGEGHH